MRSSPGVPADSLGAPGWVYGGFAIARSLEFSAREKGVQFILNRHMDELIREQQFSGRVLGVKASYTPRMHPETGARLESFWQNGNIDERADMIHIRAQEGRHRRHRRHAGQRAAAHHDRSEAGRAVDRVRAERPDGAAPHGRQRDCRRHEDRREPCGHDAELPALVRLSHDQQRARDPRYGGQHLPRHPSIPVRAGQGNQYRRCRMGTCDRGEPGGAAILQ